ncbi:LexA DNA binding domain-containing protein [Natronincola peptidivorans]|uniref:LexA DNA binding domain-containing protein n=1 Tax=Natronincola peptidivorans TaxID=426128 RepID=A0A1H9Y923_9FIRM|nr:hypothetical protein [Natronincola peptidivorans]SES65326.1 LexA DNA binding domain-containing protein [Natronincola peptidivorans]
MGNGKLSILRAIEKYIRENGFNPTVGEVCRSLSIYSPNKVHSYLNQLEVLGIIEKQEIFQRGAMKITDKGREVIRAYEIIG